MIKNESISPSYGIEEINLISDCHAISFNNNSGATYYDIRFYFAYDTTGNGDFEFTRLTQASGDYKIISVWEDSEVGVVEFQLGNSFYKLNFGHDGNEPLTCRFSEMAQPDGWTFNKTMTYLFPDIKSNVIEAFVADRTAYFHKIHDDAASATEALIKYFKYSVFGMPHTIAVNIGVKWCD